MNSPEQWTPGQQHAHLERLASIRDRLALARSHPTTGHLAHALDPTNITTPALAVIDAHIEWLHRTPGARLMISAPSQEGKSLRAAVHAPIRLLQLDPDRRILIVTHSEELATRHARTARDLIRDHGRGSRDPLTGHPLPDKIGLALAPDTHAAGSWRIHGHRGGVTARGIHSALPGLPADILIIDDPHPGMIAADSATERGKTILVWETALKQRLPPEGRAIYIGTRWHREDLAGHLLKQEPDRWRVLNFPAIAAPGIPDALGRPHGEGLESTRGDRDWPRVRDTTPARVWSAMYQGVPAPDTGDIFQQAWFDTHRHTGPLPTRALARVVAIDPADTGHGDEAGIIAATTTEDDRVILTHDLTAPMTAKQWARTAVLLALRTGATEIACEGYTAPTTYRDAITSAWETLHAQAPAHDHVIDDAPIPASPSMPFTIHMWRGKGSPLVRAGALRHAIETGTATVWEHHLALLEQHTTAWNGHSHQPDRLAAAIIAHDRATTHATATTQIATPTTISAHTTTSSMWSTPLNASDRA